MLVKLNVGGEIFWTTDDTLTSRGPNMLSCMIQHPNPARKVGDALFIDRDPKAFRWILNYLRGSRVLPRKNSPDMYLVKEEAEYYAIDSLKTRIMHMSCPSFGKNDGIAVRGCKFTIVSIEESGYVVTRGGKKFRVDSSENIEPTTVEVGDVVMAWHRPSHKRLAGICMHIDSQTCRIQFNGDIGEDECPLSGIRF